MGSNRTESKVVLLVRCVSSAVDFRSRRFRLVPLNCASRVIEVKENPKRESDSPEHSMMVDIRSLTQVRTAHPMNAPRREEMCRFLSKNALISSRV